jgi:hypothetical protein
MGRISRILIGSSLAAASAVAVMLLPISVMAAVGGTTLTLSPIQGQAGAAFTATYIRSPCKASAGTAVDFYWNAYPPNGGKLLGSAITDATCTARLTTAAPAGVKPAAYPVYGFIPTAGVPTGGTLVSATYTVEPTPAQASPSASASASAKPSAVSSPGPGASANGLFGPVPLGWLLLAALLVLPALGVLAWRQSRLRQDDANRRAA